MNNFVKRSLTTLFLVKKMYGWVIHWFRILDLQRNTNGSCRVTKTNPFLFICPQQHKLMGSSAQNTSGVHWCTLVQAPGQVQRGSGEGSEGSGEGLGSFGAGARSSFPEKVPEKVWEALVQSQVRFNRVPENVLEKVPGSLGAKPSQVQQGSGEGSREGAAEGLGGFGGSTGFNGVRDKVPEKGPGSTGAKPSQVQQVL